jgi:hypothetical protein
MKEVKRVRRIATRISPACSAMRVSLAAIVAARVARP